MSRMLSFEGASFELVKTPLPADVHDMYCAACQFWADLVVRPNSLPCTCVHLYVDLAIAGALGMVPLRGLKRASLIPSAR